MRIINTKHSQKLKEAFFTGVISFTILIISVPVFPQQPQKENIEKPSNRLANEKSPYLLHHSDDPVDWFPWGEEAFEKARKENKPIFLSIGYSSCHWCHVMERESFENPRIARLMNEVFVSIKVDREERPDIDSIYMTVAHILNGSGGWPLTIIMTPDKKPFFAATYIPDEPRFGRPGMTNLIPAIQNLWIEQQDEIHASAEQIYTVLKDISTFEAEENEKTNTSHLTEAYNQLLARFDRENGGFSTVPKFPTTTHLVFLLRYWKRTGESQALEMVEKTLKSMSRGGLFDHIGYGFHRYSTDSDWIVPHFEKMLYDQALLSMVYTEAYQATGKEEYRDTARSVLDFVFQELLSPEGGFYTSLDADSGGEEGSFYMWTYDEIQRTLKPWERELAFKAYNIKEEGNFQEPTTGLHSGKNILYRTKSIEELSSELGIPEEKLENRLRKIREKLYTVRQKRNTPLLDDKILTDWNGLMIAAFSKAARAFEEEKYATAAVKAADFILNDVRSPDRRLIHRYRDGSSGIPSKLDDYAFFIWGVLELYETTFDESYLRIAVDLSNDMIEHFWDSDQGGFYSTPDDGEEILVRKKEIFDWSFPSGNAVALHILLRLGRITADSHFSDKANTLAGAFSKIVNDYPVNHTYLLSALDFIFGPSYEVILIGKKGTKDTKSLINSLNKTFLPNKIVIFREDGGEQQVLDAIASYTKDYKSIGGKATVYVCQNYTCDLPVTDKDRMLVLLNRDQPGNLK